MLWEVPVGELLAPMLLVLDVCEEVGQQLATFPLPALQLHHSTNPRLLLWLLLLLLLSYCTPWLCLQCE